MRADVSGSRGADVDESEEYGMQDPLMTFNGEKNAGLLLIGIGLVGIAAAAVFFQARWGLRSLAVTLGVLALAQIALGVGLYLRTDPQVKGLIAQLGAVYSSAIEAHPQ